MKAYDKKQPLIALHVPKTGGNSFLELLKIWFPGERLFLHYKVGEIAPIRHVLLPSTCVYGHFNSARGWGALDYYPTINQFVTFLREPFDRFLSQWFFLNQLKRTGSTIPGLEDDPTFEVWLHRRAEEQAIGKNSFSFVWQLPLAPNRRSIETIFAENFIFIGIMERFTESIACLANILGTAALPLAHLNVTKRETNDFLKYRSYFEKFFSDEVGIYEQALKVNSAMIESVKQQG